MSNRSKPRTYQPEIKESVIKRLSLSIVKRSGAVFVSPAFPCPAQTPSLEQNVSDSHFRSIVKLVKGVIT